MTRGPMIDLAGLALLPAGTEALVFDMDGVLIDSVAADMALCRHAADAVLGDSEWLRREAIITHFALHPEAFWVELVKDAPRAVNQAELEELVRLYNQARKTAEFVLVPGAVALLEAAKAAGLKLAVASSNDVEVVEAILANVGLGDAFAAVAGISEGIAGKPSPDIYLKAARDLGVAPERCAFIEDSVTGLIAGREAGYGHAIAVATGATSIDALTSSGLAHVCHAAFEAPKIRFIDGQPTDKSIVTPNDFVSHMVEHIAWRLGTGIDLKWASTDWTAMGRALGQEIHTLGLEQASAASLGMIDDGAAECLVDFTGTAGTAFSGHHSLDMDRILDMRVEQVGAGRELIALLDGLSEGLGARIEVRLCTFEDPHHSWEGVYRALGITLNRLRIAA